MDLKFKMPFSSTYIKHVVGGIYLRFWINVTKASREAKDLFKPTKYESEIFNSDFHYHSLPMNLVALVQDFQKEFSQEFTSETSLP